MKKGKRKRLRPLLIEVVDSPCGLADVALAWCKTNRISGYRIAKRSGVNRQTVSRFFSQNTMLRGSVNLGTALRIMKSCGLTVTVARADNGVRQENLFEVGT